MRLREDIARPERLEDEMATYRKTPRPVTTPAFPHLLRARVSAYNPDLPPAAFPSLLFQIREGNNFGDGMEERRAFDTVLRDEECSEVEEPLKNPSYPKTRPIPMLPSVTDALFDDEMISSGESTEDSLGGGDGLQQPKMRRKDIHLDHRECPPENIEWKHLCPAVQLAIVGRMLDEYPMSKIYDMLSLYAQELSELRVLVMRYNIQREVEDSLTFSMRRDQLNGILRTDHTSTLRGAPDAYQEIQTQSYIKKIQQQVDERLMQATRNEIALGEKFLIQHEIPRYMVGSWGTGSERAYSTCNGDRHLNPHEVLRAIGTGLESGPLDQYLPTKNPELSSSSSHHQETQGRQNSGSQKPRLADDRNDEVRDEPALGEADHLRPVDEGTPAGSRGRFQRTIRRTPKYQEAMAELKLRGSGQGNDWNFSYDHDQFGDVELSRQQTPLRIPAESGTSSAQSRFSTPTVIKKLAMTALGGSWDKPLKPPSVASKGQSSFPEGHISPLPLPRIVLRPPRTLQRANPQTIASGAVVNGFSRGLRMGRPVATSALGVVEANAASICSPASQDSKEEPQSDLAHVPMQRRQGGSTTSTFLSPTVRLGVHADQEVGDGGTMVQPCPGNDGTMDSDSTTDEQALSSGALANRSISAQRDGSHKESCVESKSYPLHVAVKEPSRQFKAILTNNDAVGQVCHNPPAAATGLVPDSSDPAICTPDTYTDNANAETIHALSTTFNIPSRICTPKTKKRYTKSEAQRAKETARKERLVRERQERREKRERQEGKRIQGKA